MINKKSIMALIAVGLLSMSVTAWAAPGKFSVQADEMEYDLKSGNGTAKGNVVIVQDDGKATANHAKFNSKTKSGTLTGNVVADRGTSHITCQTFIAHNENDLSAVGGANITKDGKSVQADRIDYYKGREYAETIGSWARLTDVDGSVLNASKIDYDMKAGIAKAYNGVTINSPARKLDASADNAVYETGGGGYIDLIGHAKATQDGNSVASDKLHLTNTNVAVADGNVRVFYIPEQKPAADEQQTVAVKEPAIVKEEQATA